MATKFQGKGYVYGNPGAFVLYPNDSGTAISGYISPAIESCNLTYNAEIEEIKSEGGDIVATIHSGGHLEATFELRPEGDSVAEAKASARIPDMGATMQLTGMPVIAAGPFSDAFNTDGSGILANRWLATGQGSIRTTQSGKAMVTATFRRYEYLAPTAGAIALS